MNPPQPYPIEPEEDFSNVWPPLKPSLVHRGRKQRKIRKHVKVLMLFLEHHKLDDLLQQAQLVERCYKQPCVEMRGHLRDTIGEMNWRRYLDFYRHYTANEKESITIEPTSHHKSYLPPPLPILSEALNANVTQVIFSFLDDKKIYEATKISRSFRDALIPRQRNITIAGFSSFEAFSRMDFHGAIYFSGEQSPLATDEVLRSLVTNDTRYPNLTRIDIFNCSNASDTYQVSCQTEMGPRLDRFYSPHHYYDCPRTGYYWERATFESV